MLLFRDSLSKFDYLLAALAGAVMALAFAPFELRPFAWLSPAVLFWLNLKSMPLGRRLRLSWAFGVGMFAGGAHWIYVSIHFFGGANAFIAAFMVAVFVMLMALFMLVFGWLASYCGRLPTAVRLLAAFPAIWVLTEWFRGWFLTGFPWLQLGITQVDNWLANYAPVTGVLGISWLVALGSGALVLIVLGTLRERAIAAALVVATVAVGFGLGQIRWTQPTGEPLYVSMLQGNVDQLTKWEPQFRNENIQAYLNLMDPDRYPDVERSHLVIWPETALADFFPRSLDVLEPLQDWAREAKADLLVGGFYLNRDTEAVYNAVMAIGGDRDVGKSIETSENVYAKKHLVPFSEYIPLLKYLRFLESIIRLPYDNVTAWEGRGNLVLAGQPMRLSVCYEDVYGEELIQGLPEATMLVNVSNDGWFTGSIEPAQHAEIARMRALETGRFLLRATNNGVSAIINEKGKVLKTGPQYEATVISGYAVPLSGTTPYVRTGNWLIIPLMLILLGVPLLLARRKP
ncbi:apolipoprotein N-acyltransferase [Candidatus Thiothrix sp. Deng01]|uniref:Apolipoprotein N-acyltransferase n=1 Tax=Candidatus Thiothrix phosphatis TaxID=3112415 RepID=A0ABU6CYX1_9GAMM|nr:apolipoprotein N-acyltransferase [Candidatus Thiothrix sp. Deng01]MEB4591756.1 apolipoprotein N-acyltransferase [Candidatus Thiothrix sp. Deng01]